MKTRLTRVLIRIFCLALCAFLWFLLPVGWAGPNHVYLTWQGDTSTTMTVNVHTPAKAPDVTVHYDSVPREMPGQYRYQARGQSHTIPGLKDGRHVHHIELTGLEPGTTYYFRVGTTKKTFGPEYSFRTIPNDGSPLRFISGGDLDVVDRTRALLKQGAPYDPMFAIMGGDLAYANGNLKSIDRWDTFFDNWDKLMRTSDGRLVPMVAAIGNHETNGDHEAPEENAPFYYGFFAQGGLPYFSLDFGPDLRVITLDSGHTVPHAGVQTAWLKDTLATASEVPYTLAVYHVPLYPSHRDFEGDSSVAGRTHWLPLFDKYKVDVCFENHDHVHKRSKRLRGGKIDPEGTLYLGDGSWGRGPRDPEEPLQWYLETASNTPHVWVVDVNNKGMQFRAIDQQGVVFDTCSLPAASKTP